MILADLLMFVVDTNFVSEIFKPRPDAGVLQWLKGTPRPALFVSAVVMAELFAGVALMPSGRKRNSLTEMIDEFIDDGGNENILVFGPREAILYAGITARRSLAGRPVKSLDAQIAATAAARQFSVVTRNVRDFEGCGVTIINPWLADAA